MTKGKRWFAVLIACILLLALLPQAVFAGPDRYTDCPLYTDVSSFGAPFWNPTDKEHNVTIYNWVAHVRVYQGENPTIQVEAKFVGSNEQGWELYLRCDQARNGRDQWTATGAKIYNRDMSGVTGSTTFYPIYTPGSGSYRRTIYLNSGAPIDQPPDKPGDTVVQDLLQNGAVTIDCVNAQVSHADKTYGLLAGGYTVGQPYAQGSGYAADVTVTPAPYVARYNTDIGEAHTLDPANQGDKTIQLLYNKQTKQWSVAPGAAPVTYTVLCDTPEPIPGAPDIPTVEKLLKDGAVTIDCVNAQVSHADKTYGLLAGGYTIGQPYAQGSGYAADVTVTPAPYVTRYNTDIGKTHTLEPANQGNKTIQLLYNKQSKQWSVAPGAAPVTYTVLCDTPEPTPGAPDGPTVEKLLKDGAVTIDCVNAEAGHADKTYGLLAGGYAIGTVTGTDGVFQCLVTVTPEPYVARYNTDIGKNHLLAPRDQGPLTIALRYDVELERWYLEEVAAPVRYTVRCETAAETCFVYYYSNDPSGSVNQSYTDGGAGGKGYPLLSQVRVLGNPFTPPAGYRFSGWNTRPDGSGVAYEVGALLTLRGDVRLYAQWTRSSSGPGVYFPEPGANPGAGDLTGGTRPSALEEDTNPNTGGAENGRAMTVLAGSVLCLGAVLALRRRGVK